MQSVQHLSISNLLKAGEFSLRLILAPIAIILMLGLMFMPGFAQQGPGVAGDYAGVLGKPAISLGD